MTATDSISRPRLFLSSTVHDFRDLRLALKYWLEELGYEVQLSDLNDFDRQPDDGTFAACFRGVAAADYYLLLIGDRKGQLYDPANGISVTQQEYKTAYESWRTGRRPQLLLFIRRETMIRLRNSTSDNNTEGDATFIRQFVDEVRRKEDAEKAATAQSDYPGANWLTEFDSFRDLTETLRSLLNKHGPLQQAAVLEDLRQELSRNLRTMMWKINGRPSYRYLPADSVREHTQITPDDLDGSIQLTYDDLKRLIIYIPTNADALVSSAIEYAVHSGVLLDFDSDRQSFVASPLLTALHELREDLAVYRARFAAFDEDFRTLLQLWSNVRENRRGGHVPTLTLLHLFGIVDAEQNVVRITLAILRFLYGNTEEVTYQRRPRSPIVGEDEKIEESLVSEAELDAALERDSLLLTIGTVDMTQEQSAALQEGQEKIESLMGQDNYRSYSARFQELFLQEVPDTAEAVSELTKRVLDELNIVPSAAQRISEESAKPEEQ